MPNRQKSKIRFAFFLLVLYAAFGSDAGLCAALGENSKRQKDVVLMGHVVANIYGLSDYLLVGEPGFNAKAFIFAVDSPAGQRKPVKISYQFFKQDPRLPGSFFTYFKVYALRVKRDVGCDESVKHLSHMKNVEAGTGKELEPTNVLHVLDGAPKDMINPEAVLPCYVLTPGKYKVISQNGGSRNSATELKK